MSYTYGAAPEHVVTDTAGNVLPGVDLQVWTAENGTQIAALYTIDGQPLPGVVPTDEQGRYRFMIDSNTYPTVWLREPSGGWWQVSADQVLDQIPNAIADSAEALALATETSSALGEITVLVDKKFSTEDQMNGTDDASSAWQAALETGASRIVFPPGTVWLFDGSSQVDLRSKVEIDLAGTIVKKTDGAGYYNIFAARSHGATGWASGVTDVIIRNGYFQGNLANGGSLCLLAANHAARFLIENCEFAGCQYGGHILDLGGCEDFTIRNLIMRGYRISDNTAPRGEAIQLDQSANGAGVSDDPGSFDGLLCRRITIENIQALPYTDPADGNIYPAPCPVGAHSQREGQWYEDITIRNVLVVNPPVDPATTSISGEDAWIRGLFHFPTIKRLHMSDIKIVATDGLGTIRAVMVQSRASGHLADSDPNAAGTTGTWATPQGCEDIWIDRLSIHGMGGVDSTLNPQVLLLGCEDAPVTNATVNMTSDGNSTETLYLNRCQDVDVTMHCTNSDTGANIINSRRIGVTGSFQDTVCPIRQDNSYFVTLTGIQAETGTPADQFALLTNGSDYLGISNVVTSGWTGLLNAVPTHYAEAAAIPAAADPA